MKTLFLAFAVLSTSTFSEERINCECEFMIGLTGVPQSEELKKVKTKTTRRKYLNASAVEVDIALAYKCLKKFKKSGDVRQVTETKSITCDETIE